MNNSEQERPRKVRSLKIHTEVRIKLVSKTLTIHPMVKGKEQDYFLILEEIKGLFPNLFFLSLQSLRRSTL